MTRCAECSEVQGRDVDHAPDVQLPPIPARFEHFLATRGALVRPVGRVDEDLPTIKHRVPGKPLAEKNVWSIASKYAAMLTKLGVLAKGGPGRWVTVDGKDVRDLGVEPFAAYMARRFPVQVCDACPPGCGRCCLEHHLNTYNAVCELLHKLALWLRFGETRFNRPVWSTDKVAAMYAVTARYAVKESDVLLPADLETLLDFRAWLGTEAAAEPPANGGASAEIVAKARAMYRRTKDAAAVARKLGLPHTTVYFWVTDRSRARGKDPTYARLLKEQPRAIAAMLWMGQELYSRYEEIAYAEFPLAGPYVTLNRLEKSVRIVGKGREFGKPRTVFLTDEQIAELDRILAWRKDLGAYLKAWTGRKPDPTLFVVLHADPAKAGRSYSYRGSASYNRTLQAWARRYNESPRAKDAGRAIDVARVGSHNIGRAVAITKALVAGMPEELVMDQAGIEESKTLKRYWRATGRDRRRIVDAMGGGTAKPAGPTNGDVLVELRALREEIRKKDEELRAERDRNRELQDRLVAAFERMPAAATPTTQ